MSLEKSAKERMQGILQEFECPVCLNFMIPPIYTCVAGHSLCPDCDGKLRICPICRGQKRGIRNWGLENIFKKLIVPCKNASKGCSTEVQGARFEEHLKFCQYSITICPLRAIHNCRWKGQRKDSIEHCFQQHSSNVHGNSIMHIGEIEQGSTYHMIMRAHGKVFKCVADFFTFPDMMIWHVICMDPETNPDKYYYEVVYHGLDISDDALAFGRSRCQANDSAVHKENGLLIKFNDKVKNVCSERGSYCTFSIYEFKEDGEDLNTLSRTPINNNDSQILSRSLIIPEPSMFLDLNGPGFENVIQQILAFED